MRAAPLDDLLALFCARWQQTRDLEDCLKTVRDRILLGADRARARSGIADRKRRRAPSRQHRSLAATDAVVLERVAEAGGLDVADLTADNRSRTASSWRFVAMWVLHRARKRSLPEVAAVLRRRDHSCVHRGVGIVDERVKLEPRLGAKLRRLAA